MNENERPALGSPEAAVRSIVNLISLATHTDEEKLAYWLDAYYQVRAAYEHADEAEPFRPAVPPDLEILEALGNKLDALTDQVRKSMDLVASCFVQVSGALAFGTGPSSKMPGLRLRQKGQKEDGRCFSQNTAGGANAPPAVGRAPTTVYTMKNSLAPNARGAIVTRGNSSSDTTNARATSKRRSQNEGQTGYELPSPCDLDERIRVHGSPTPAPTEADKAEVPDNNVGNKAAEAEELPPAILKSSRVLPSADQAAIQNKKRTRSQEAAAADKSQRAYKMRVADRLRKVRAEGVTTAQIVEAGHGSVPDGAVLGIVGGEFRPIDDYLAIDAALDALETE